MIDGPVPRPPAFLCLTGGAHIPLGHQSTLLCDRLSTWRRHGGRTRSVKFLRNDHVWVDSPSSGRESEKKGELELSLNKEAGMLPKPLPNAPF